MFNDILKNIRGAIAGFNQQNPSVVGNLVTGQPWNQGISRFGGVPKQNQMIDNPNIASPIPSTEQMTPGLIYRQKLEDLRAKQPKTPSNYTPKTVKYPEWMANAPQKKASPSAKPVSPVDSFVKQQVQDLKSKLPNVTTQSDPSVIMQLIHKYFPEDPKTAAAVFMQESNLGKVFQNSQGAPAYGVAQIYLPYHRDKIPGNTDNEKIQWLANPENNLKLARKIYDASNGWSPWEAFTSGAYRKYL